MFVPGTLRVSVQYSRWKTKVQMWYGSTTLAMGNLPFGEGILFPVIGFYTTANGRGVGVEDEVDFFVFLLGYFRFLDHLAGTSFLREGAIFPVSSGDFSRSVSRGEECGRAKGVVSGG